MLPRRRRRGPIRPGPGGRPTGRASPASASRSPRPCEYAHGQGILHRDIKPSNLLLDTRGTVWVADFGLAKADDQQNLTHTGDILGTLRYMPPEAFEGRSDARGDVYSLGLTLYELLAFRPAFDETDRARLISQVTARSPPRLSRLNPAIPRDLETIVHKAIDRDPAHRYATAGELAADLQRFLDDEPIRARRLSPAERRPGGDGDNRGLAASLCRSPPWRWSRGRSVSLVMAIRANDLCRPRRSRAVRPWRWARPGRPLAEERARRERRSAGRGGGRAAGQRRIGPRRPPRGGLSLVDQKDSARGMLWLARALELDPDDASGVHHAVRVNLMQTAREPLRHAAAHAPPRRAQAHRARRPSDEIVSIAWPSAPTAGRWRPHTG